ncbi:MAG: 3'-5' exonuclease [Acidobacteriota bacterium]|nr:3'-5' exonuclease [Acidobacteriota bacterium]
MTVRNSKIFESSFAILDVETTGLRPGEDRVVEVGVVHLNPTGEVVPAFNSLVKPNRPMAGTEIHGITNEDIKDAPTFEEIARSLVEAISGRVIVGHNVYFDMRFLNYEFARLDLQLDVPIICTMALRSMLGIGKRCKLEEACAEAGIPLSFAHSAFGDAMACACLMKEYLNHMTDLRTFDDLARLKKLKFTESLDFRPLPPEIAKYFPSSRACKPRDSVSAESDEPITIVPDYTGSLLGAAADYEITEEEIIQLEKIKAEQGLSVEQIKAIHARVLAWVLTGLSGDSWIDHEEEKALRHLMGVLHRLGWAPGD